ncbi:MAG: ribosome silencing factor [Verrucomicrobiae bacterium]|nr:ribosome silencing factor [Verrucomicrobiae bacterium]
MTTLKRKSSTKKETAEKTVVKKATSPKKTVVKKVTSPKDIDAEEALARFCVEAALDKKAEDPIILDLRAISSFADFFVIVSASSEPQIKAVASSIRDRMRTEKGIPPHADDAYPGSRWIVIDFGNIIVHIFHQELRKIYDLESLWNDSKKIVVKEEKEPRKILKSKKVKK